jgi:hypothetical protein
MTVDTRKLVMGDWGPVVRDPLDVVRLVFLAGAIAFAAAADVAGAFNLALGFVLLVAARFANLPRIYDLALIVALIFTQWGEAFGLYDTIAWYDRVVHVVVPMLASQVVYLCLARIEVMPDPAEDRGRLRLAARRRADGAVGEEGLGLRAPHPRREPPRAGARLTCRRSDDSSRWRSPCPARKLDLTNQPRGPRSVRGATDLLHFASPWTRQAIDPGPLVRVRRRPSAR